MTSLKRIICDNLTNKYIRNEMLMFERNNNGILNISSPYIFSRRFKCILQVPRDRISTASLCLLHGRDVLCKLGRPD